jgi:hypothetical protein
LLCIYAIQIFFSFILFLTYFYLFFDFNILKLIFLSYIYLQLIFRYSIIETIDCIYFYNCFLVILITNYHAIADIPLWVLWVLVLTKFYFVGFKDRLLVYTNSTFRPAVILLLDIIIVLYLIFIYDFIIFIISIFGCKNIGILLIVN